MSSKSSKSLDVLSYRVSFLPGEREAQLLEGII